MYFVCLDETTFGNAGQYSGYGCLITDYRIGPEVIDEALKRLNEDPETKESAFLNQDSRTLDRGYFHAADDSKNAHSHLCVVINEHVVGRFSSCFFNTRKKAFRNTSEAYSLASNLAILNVFSETPEVTFVFEERNDLTLNSIRAWWATLWEDLLKSSYSLPYRTNFFPRLNFEIEGKTEPGLQIVDFLLWAAGRKTLKKNCPWIDRIRPSVRIETKPSDNSWGGQSIAIKFNPKRNVSHYCVNDYRHDDPKLSSQEMLWQYLIHAQKTINIVYNNGPTLNIEHFWEDIGYLYQSRINDRSPDFIEKLATCFLKLFDNYPLITAETSLDDKAFWLFCRKCMAYAIDKSCVLARMHAIKLHDMRRYLIDHDSKCLESC
jgi:hypothetical protein